MGNLSYQSSESNHLSYEEIQAIAREIKIEIYSSDIKNPLFISRKSAYKRYGQARVKRWIENGDIRCISNGSNKTDIRVEDLERIASKQQYLEGLKGVPVQVRRKKKTTNHA